MLGTTAAATTTAWATTLSSLYTCRRFISYLNENENETENSQLNVAKKMTEQKTKNNFNNNNNKKA